MSEQRKLSPVDADEFLTDEAMQGITHKIIENADDIVTLDVQRHGAPSTAAPSPAQANKASAPADNPLDGFVPLSQTKEPVWEFLWYPYIPLREVTTMAGCDGVGKSFLSSYIAAKVSTGEPFFASTESRSPANVIFFNHEDEADNIGDRLKGAGADPDRILIADSEVCFKKKFSILTQTGLDRIEKAVTAFNAKLLIFDPVQSFTGDADLNQGRDVRPILQNLQHIAKKCNIAVVLIEHFKKNAGQSGNINDSISGSKELTNAGRSTVTVFTAPKKEDQREEDEDVEEQFFVHTKINHGAKKGKTLVYAIVSDEQKPQKGRLEWLRISNLTKRDFDSAGMMRQTVKENRADDLKWRILVERIDEYFRTMERAGAKPPYRITYKDFTNRYGAGVWNGYAYPKRAIDKAQTALLNAGYIVEAGVRIFPQNCVGNTDLAEVDRGLCVSKISGGK